MKLQSNSKFKDGMNLFRNYSKIEESQAQDLSYYSQWVYQRERSNFINFPSPLSIIYIASYSTLRNLYVSIYPFNSFICGSHACVP